jgi:hypothetical protein
MLAVAAIATVMILPAAMADQVDIHKNLRNILDRIDDDQTVPAVVR